MEPISWLKETAAARTKLRISLEWIVVSYRAIAFYSLAALALVAITVYLITPNYIGRKLKKALAVISGGVTYTSEAVAATTKREVHIVNLEGTVRVKKVQSLLWTRADYNTVLEKGDFLQTSSDGFARIIFADGTNYLLKPSSLILVQEARQEPATRATRVSVRVSSGAVDLATGKFEIPGSTSQVAFADAVASLAEDTRAVVRNNPAENRHELTVDQGQADVQRGSASIRLGQYEQVTFDPRSAGLTHQTVIPPPTLLTPTNMDLMMSEDPKRILVNFSWSEVPEAGGYHLQVSSSAMFSKFVVDRKIMGRTSTQGRGLDEGTYYWVVSSIDSRGVESQPTQANRFSLVQQVETASPALLEITQIVQHGRVVEIVGRTDPGASVIINNEQVFSIAPDGTFHHFTSPIAEPGPSQLTVTAQNRQGETNTLHRTIVVE